MPRVILDGASSLAIETHCVPDGMRGDFLVNRLAEVAIAIGVDDGDARLLIAENRSTKPATTPATVTLMGPVGPLT